MVKFIILQFWHYLNIKLNLSDVLAPAKKLILCIILQDIYNLAICEGDKI